jgi:hypothetical protein
LPVLWIEKDTGKVSFGGKYFHLYKEQLLVEALDKFVCIASRYLEEKNAAYAYLDGKVDQEKLLNNQMYLDMKNAMEFFEKVQFIKGPAGIVREEVDWFSHEMEQKLSSNDHKGGWKECDNFFFLDKLDEEVRELAQAVLHNQGSQRIIEEAADAANIAMMIADNNKQ